MQTCEKDFITYTYHFFNIARIMY